MTDLYLTVDVGTGSVRSALVDTRGEVLAIASREHQQNVPRHGWSEQRPADWWLGAQETIRQVLSEVPDAAQRVAAVCACGQMHATVLIDDDGALMLDAVPLWNDKRTATQVAAFQQGHPGSDYLKHTANPATPAWPGFKLQWIKQHQPAAYERASTVFMSKDYVNFQLTGERACDWSDASTSFLMEPTTRTWSAAMLDTMGIDATKLPTIRSPLDILGTVTSKAAEATGLRAGTPVLVGGADYPVSILGSGVIEPGAASDITGTSSIITVIADTPMLHPEVSNVATTEGLWGRFMLLDSGGDATRWARRAFHDNTLGYDVIAERAAEAPVGSEALFFLPYLTGERFGEHANSRAQFFGISAKHGLSHLHRAVLEGVAFGVRRHIGILVSAGARVDRIVAASGGAKAALWLQIKASLYNVPVLVPAQVEGGVLGCAMLAATAMGQFPRLADAAAAFVRYEREVLPDPRATEIYDRMFPLFEKLYLQSQQFYDELDRLGEAAR